MSATPAQSSMWQRALVFFSREQPPAAIYVPLPTDKLRGCKDARDARRRLVVLVACGSFNPPTVAHLRMFDLAEHALAQVESADSLDDTVPARSADHASMQADLSLPLQAGYDVLGGYLSPVNDGYGKPGLLPAAHRLRMCELAADAAPAVMVDRRAPRSNNKRAMYASVPWSLVYRHVSLPLGCFAGRDGQCRVGREAAGLSLQAEDLTLTLLSHQVGGRAARLPAQPLGPGAGAEPAAAALCGALGCRRPCRRRRPGRG